MKRAAIFLLAVLCLTAISIDIAHTHSGGLDKYGCHNDRKRGGYHCHGASASGCSFL